MKIYVKLFASFQQYLPSSDRVHGELMEIQSSTTPLQLLGELHVPLNEIHIVLLNGVYIEPNRRNAPIFSENDTLAVWPAVAGG